MMKQHKIGKNGEDVAAEFLVEKQYTILARNYRVRQGEIDIIAQQEGYIVFVEVKTRNNSRFAQAREFVTLQKQKRIIMAALSWLSDHRSTLQPRFDVIEVYWPNGAVTPRAIEQIQSAFEAS